MLIRNVRLIDGTGAAHEALRQRSPGGTARVRGGRARWRRGAKLHLDQVLAKKRILRA